MYFCINNMNSFQGAGGAPPGGEEEAGEDEDLKDEL